MKKFKFSALALLSTVLLVAPTLSACGPKEDPTVDPSDDTPGEDEVTLSRISVTTRPTKTEYNEGEIFDPTGMVVEAIYSDKSRETVTDYTYDKHDPLTLADTTVTISWHDKTTSLSITVSYVPEEGSDIVRPKAGETVRFEAENVNIDDWVISSANPEKVIARADASNGHFLAAATGDTANSGTFEFEVDLEFNAEITLTAAYAQTDKWKTYDEDMSKTYGFLIDENKSVSISTDNILHAREDITVWQRMTYDSFTLPTGKHTIKCYVISNTSTGTPNIDYIDFASEEIDELPPDPSEIVPENDFHTSLQWQYINDEPENYGKYAKGVSDLSRPAGNVLSFEEDGLEGSSFVLEYADNADFTGSKKLTGLTSPKATVKNFKLGQDVYYRGATQESGLASATVHHFKVNTLGPRNVDIPGVDNARDIGGYESTLIEDGVIEQGLYYRCANINALATNTEGARVLKEDLGVKAEIDLRDSYQNTGPYVDGVDYYAIPIPSGTESTRFEQFAPEYKQVFELIANADTAPIALHCTAGADRTGIMTFGLLTVLGANYKDILRDYCFTNFGTQGERRPDSEFTNWWAKLDNYSGVTKAEKAKAWLKTKGISDDTIETIREKFVPGYEKGQDPYVPADYKTLEIDENGTYSLEAEDGDFTQTVFRADLHDGEAVIKNDAASGGKYLNAFDAVNKTSWGQYTLHFKAEKDCDVNLSMLCSMPNGVAVGSLYKRFYVKLDGATDFGNCTGLSERSELDWEESTWPNKVHVTAGEHTIVFTPREGTGTGSPYIDKFIFTVSGAAEGGEEPDDEIPENALVLEEEKVRYEAEEMDLTSWVISGDNPSKIVEREDASGGKFVAASTGNDSTAGTASFQVYAKEAGTYSLSGAFVQAEAKKSKVVPMDQTYKFTVDGTTSVGLHGTLEAREDTTVWETLSFDDVTLTKGLHTFVLSVVSNTGKGTANIDYFEFDPKESGEEPIDDEIPEGAFVVDDHKARYEAEDVDATGWKDHLAGGNSDAVDGVVSRADASGGKFLAAETGDTTKSSTAKFDIYVKEAGTYSIRGAFAQVESKKGNDVPMDQTYKFTIDGTTEVALNGTLNARDDITVWQTLDFDDVTLTKGSHTFVISVVSNTNKGTANIDYFDFAPAIPEETGVGEHGAVLSAFEKTRFEAEDIDATGWKDHLAGNNEAEGAVVDGVFEREGTSGGKALAGETGNTANSSTATFNIYAQAAGTYSITGAFVQVKALTNHPNMRLTYKLTIDGVDVLLEDTELVTEDLNDWKVLAFDDIDLTKGLHTVVLSVVSNTNKGTAHIDYFDFLLK